MKNRHLKLLDDLAAARQQILDLVGEVPPDQRDVIFLGQWCIKDLLAHMIGWDATNQRSVREILSGERPFFFQYYDKDWQRYNALLVSTYRREAYLKTCRPLMHSCRHFYMPFQLTRY